MTHGLLGSSELGVSFAFAGMSISDPLPRVRKSLRQPGHQFLLVYSCWLVDFSSVGVGQSACLLTFDRSTTGQVVFLPVTNSLCFLPGLARVVKRSTAGRALCAMFVMWLSRVTIIIL